MKISRTSLLILGATICSGCVGHVANTKAPAGPPPAQSTIKVSVTPATANVRADESYTFSATVTGTSHTAVTWSVNGISGGSATLGTINSSGKYTAPSSLPSPNSLTIRATSAASSTVSATSTATILNPTPVLTGINPASVGNGNFTITVAGSKFVSGAQVSLSGLSLQTSYVSATQLTAKGSASSAGTFPVTVTNPDPGASTSSSASLEVTGSTQASSCGSMQTGQGASLGGFVPFPADSLWNKDISTAAVDANSTATINYLGGTAAVHADFGAGQYQGSTIGIPYVVVGGSQALAAVNLTDYADESDPGPMPIPANANIEGYPNPGSGDRHVLVLDNSHCFLYELYNSSVSGTTWSASSTAVWDLLSNEQRPYGWTSADAGGLPIFPGLLRYDEVAAGHVNHAIRFTLQHSKAAFVLPATHWAANTSNAAAAPMGMRVRLRAGFDVSSYSPANKVILAAMKKYGMIMADNGSNMYISGAPDDRWNNDDLHALGSLKASDFEVIAAPTIYTASNVPAGSAPHISSFTASSPSVLSGTQVTLSWQATGATYVIVSPGAGAVRGTSVVVTPTQTTTYTLYATNVFGRTKSTAAVTVH